MGRGGILEKYGVKGGVRPMGLKVKSQFKEGGAQILKKRGRSSGEGTLHAKLEQYIRMNFENRRVRVSPLLIYSIRCQKEKPETNLKV